MTLKQAKDDRRRDVENRRKTRPITITVAGVKWDAGEKAQRRLLTAVVGLADTDSISWIDAANKIRPVSVSRLREILAAIARSVEARRVHARALKDQIRKARNVAAVKAIDIDTGWPG